MDSLRVDSGFSRGFTGPAPGGSSDDLRGQDAALHAGNGWSLFGVAESLHRQKKVKNAAAARKRVEDTWKRADGELTASRL